MVSLQAKSALRDPEKDETFQTIGAVELSNLGQG